MFYKFALKELGIKFYRFFYPEAEELVFISIEIPETGQRIDGAVKVDDEFIHLIEFLSHDLDEDKLLSMADYHDYTRMAPQYYGKDVKSSAISIADPNRGINCVKRDDNSIFFIDVFFLKNIDGWEVLNNISDKVKHNEELSDDEVISLLVLSDMKIEMPIEDLMRKITELMAIAIIPDKTFKHSSYKCFIVCLSRFFSNGKLMEMIDLFSSNSGDEVVKDLTDKYGGGFGQLYLDGKSAGFADGKSAGFADGKSAGITEARLEDARNFFAEGVDEEIIFRCTGITVDQIKDFERKL